MNFKLKIVWTDERAKYNGSLLQPPESLKIFQLKYTGDGEYNSFQLENGELNPKPNEISVTISNIEKALDRGWTIIK